MTETIYTVLEKYEIRKTKQQKSAFIDYVTAIAAKNGYTCHTERGSLGARNIMVGNPDRAQVVYTAHYDTCAWLPVANFITPKNMFIYLLYQLMICVLLYFLPMVITSFILAFCIALAGLPAEWLFLVTLAEFILVFVISALIMAGPANKHTVNDNTSGVTVLLSLMETMPAEMRKKAAFVFFDLEEIGLVGSASFAKRHKAAMKTKLLVNFDCVSDGEHMLMALTKGARKHASLLKNAFPSTEAVTCEVATRGVFYPSDQVKFSCGVGAAAMRKSRLFGILYLGRIHTARDTVYREENIEFLVSGAIRLTEAI